MTPPDLQHLAAATDSAAVAIRVTNALPMPIWLLWALAPRSRASRYFTRVLWPWALLAVLYGAAIAVGLTMDPDRAVDFSSLAGIMAIFDGPWSTVAGWVHYLCFDLFAARWMMNDAPDAGYRLSPILALTLMYGHLGLLAYALARPWLHRAKA